MKKAGTGTPRAAQTRPNQETELNLSTRVNEGDNECTAENNE